MILSAVYLSHQKKGIRKIPNLHRKEMLHMKKLLELLKEFSEGFGERNEVEELLRGGLK